MEYDIRHQIYRQFFAINKAVYLTDSWPENYHLKIENPSGANDFDRGHPLKGGYSLMLTCRQLNNETTELLYGTNRFVLQPGEMTISRQPLSTGSHYFIPDLRQSTIRMLTRMELILGPRTNRMSTNAVRKTAAAISGVQNLKVRIYSSLDRDGERRRKENGRIVNACMFILDARGSNDGDRWQVRGEGSEFDGMSQDLQRKIPALEILAPDQEVRNFYR